MKSIKTLSLENCCGSIPILLSMYCVSTNKGLFYLVLFCSIPVIHPLLLILFFILFSFFLFCWFCTWMAFPLHFNNFILDQKDLKSLLVCMLIDAGCSPILQVHGQIKHAGWCLKLFFWTCSTGLMRFL